MRTRVHDWDLVRGRSTLTLDLTMSAHFERTAALRGWRAWVLGTALGEMCWFALLYPLVPRTTLAAAVEAVLAFPIIGGIYVVGRAMVWLPDLTWHPTVRRACVLALALSASSLIVICVVATKNLLGTQFGYGIFQRP